MRVAAARSLENAYWQGIANALDAHSQAGKARIYSGPVPARGAALGGSNVLIVEWTLQKPCAASIADGRLTLKDLGNGLVQSDAAHTFARFTDGAGNFVMDLDTGLLNGDAAWRFSQASYAIGSYILPEGLTFDFPA